MERKSVTINTRKQRGGKGVTLTLKGELDLKNAHEIKQKIQASLNSCNQLVINMDKIKSFDLSGLQLLYSVLQTSSASNKNVIMKINLTEDLKTLTSRAGFDQLIKSWGG